MLLNVQFNEGMLVYSLGHTCISLKALGPISLGPFPPVQPMQVRPCWWPWLVHLYYSNAQFSKTQEPGSLSPVRRQKWTPHCAGADLSWGWGWLQPGRKSTSPVNIYIGLKVQPGQKNKSALLYKFCPVVYVNSAHMFNQTQNTQMM